MKLRRLPLRLFLLLPLMAVITSCSKTKGKTELQYMPDMAKGPAVKAQQVSAVDPLYTGLRGPVPGTISADFDPYPFATADTVGPAKLMHNLLPRTMEVLQTGRKYYNTFCIVCHGYKGDGQGYIVPKFPAPPSLLTDKIREWEDGRIFHIITRGRGNMPSYAGQLNPELRWAIVHYVRALLRAAHPTSEDLKLLKQENLDILFYQDQPDTTTGVLWPKK